MFNLFKEEAPTWILAPIKEPATTTPAFCTGGKADLPTTLATAAVTAPTVPANPILLPTVLIPLLISVAASFPISTFAPTDILVGFLLRSSINKSVACA